MTVFEYISFEHNTKKYIVSLLKVITFHYGYTMATDRERPILSLFLFWLSQVDSSVLKIAIQWRHDEHDGVSNNRCLDCLLHRLFRCRSKKHQSPASLAFLRGIHNWFSSQRASNVENVSISWRHHGEKYSQVWRPSHFSPLQVLHSKLRKPLNNWVYIYFKKYYWGDFIFSVRFYRRVCRRPNDFCFSSQKIFSQILDIWDKENVGLGKCTGWLFRDLDPRSRLWQWLPIKLELFVQSRQSLIGVNP